MAAIALASDCECTALVKARSEEHKKQDPPAKPVADPAEKKNEPKALLKSFHKRILPSPPAIAFDSKEGKAIFKAALQANYMDGYFSLAEQFSTQCEPSFCGLTTLSVVLNALEVDPRRVWKGGWRWYSETMLDCCAPLEKVLKDGVTFSQALCLAKCHGLEIMTFGRGDDVEAFRAAVKEATNWTENPQKMRHLVVSYSRKTFLQSGDGHFSPIGGYNPEQDMILILDTARFKYPPHWVKLEMMCESMRELDSVTGKPRGWMLLSVKEEEDDDIDLPVVEEKSPTKLPGQKSLYFVLLSQDNDWYSWVNFIKGKLNGMACPKCEGTSCDNCNHESDSKKAKAAIGCFSELLPDDMVTGISTHLKVHGVNYVPPELKESVEQLKAELRTTEVYTLFFRVLSCHKEDSQIVQAFGTRELAAEYMSMLFLSLPKAFWNELKDSVGCKNIRRLADKSLYSELPLMRVEVKALRKQMKELLELTKHVETRCCAEVKTLRDSHCM